MSGLTIGVLSWGAPKTLHNTLKSYWQYELKGDQKIVLLQEGTPEQESICREFGYKPISYPINVGIAQGYRLLLEQAQEDGFLFLENDWELIRYPYAQIMYGYTLLRDGEADFVRYRHRTNPGYPLWTRQFEGQEYVRPSHLLDSIHWTDPDKFPEIELYEELVYAINHNYIDDDQPVEFLTDKWYRTSSRYANWTNNPHMAGTGFLLSIVPRMGSRDLEADLQGWWEQQDFRVMQSEGLFTHNRLD
jgi:hypothetical protein